MKLAISVLLFIYSLQGLSCELSSRKFVLLSSSISMLLEKLELIDSENILAISSFHPIKETTRPRVGGGIFLSVKKLKDYENALIFFDESRELEKNLKRSVQADLLSIKTRGKDPFTILEENLSALTPYLKGCGQKIAQLKKWSAKVKASFQDELKYPWIFFLGEVTKTKLPRLVIVNDLFIQFLKDKNFIKTYPSELAYINYSEKKLKDYHDYKLIGLYENSHDKIQIKKIAKNKVNLGFRGVFSPGIRQINFLENLLEVARDL